MNECEGCIHYCHCGFIELYDNNLSEEENLINHCIGCCCGDGGECNKNNGCWNWEDGSEPILG